MMLGSGDTASCGHPNPIWWTDSRLWNEVINGGDRDEEASGILCPSCFADRADAYFDGSRWRITGWRLVPDWGRPVVSREDKFSKANPSPYARLGPLEADESTTSEGERSR